MNTKLILSSLFCMAALVVAGCGGQSTPETASDATAETGPSGQVNAILLAELPDREIQPLAVYRTGKSPEAGESVVIEGRIGGVENPFTEGYALFIMADESLLFCDEMKEVMSCPKPWDACCEDPEKRRALLALVQVVDETGSPLEASLKDRGGLSENDTVVVSGVVDASSNAEKLVINADGIFRKIPGPGR